jgi:hypothetical protein
MIDKIVKTIKTNIAQHTTLFDIETRIGVTVATLKNKVYSPVVDNSISHEELITLTGEYTISGASMTKSSGGSLNRTFVFGDSTHPVSTDSFFSSGAMEHLVDAHRVSVGSAMSEDVAMEMIVDGDLHNCGLVYIGNASASSSAEINSSLDPNIKIEMDGGVIFKMDAKQAQNLGIDTLDALFTNAVLLSNNDDQYNLFFRGISGRSLVGDSYIVNIKFGYNDDLFLEKRFIDSLRNYDATIGSVATK